MSSEAFVGVEQSCREAGPLVQPPEMLLFLHRKIGRVLFVVAFDVSDITEEHGLVCVPGSYGQFAEPDLAYLGTRRQVHCFSCRPHNYEELIGRLFGFEFTEVMLTSAAYKRALAELLPPTINKADYVYYGEQYGFCEYFALED